MPVKRHKRKAKKDTEMNNQYLNAAFSEFIREKKANGLVPETIKAYEISYKKFCDTFREKVDYTGDIAVGLFTEWKLIMREEGLADATINHYITCLRTFMYWCMEDGREYIDEPFTITLIKVKEQKPKDYNIEDVEKLLQRPKNGAKFTEWRAWAICNFVMGTGARLATLVDIQIKDLDLKNRKVNYQHTKNKKLQVANMPPKLVKVIREYLNRCFDENDTLPDDYLFCDVSGGKLSKAALAQGYRKYAHSRGVQQTNIHGLRHTFAREWFVNHGDLVQLSKVLGHSTLAMSEHYMNVYADMAQDRFDECNPLETMTNRGRGKTRRRAKPLE